MTAIRFEHNIGSQRTNGVDTCDILFGKLRHDGSRLEVCDACDIAMEVCDR